MKPRPATLRTVVRSDYAEGGIGFDSLRRGELDAEAMKRRELERRVEIEMRHGQTDDFRDVPARTWVPVLQPRPWK